MLERIYASKMFAASKNQDKIAKALVDPLNGELVQQLRSYLDDDFLKEAKEHREAVQLSEPKESPNTESEGSRDENPAPDRAHDSSNPSPAPRHSSTSDFSELSDMGVPDANDGIDLDNEKPEEPDNSESQSSEDTSDEISEATDITSDVCRLDTDEIEQRLNEDAQSSGVRRVTLSGSELWIYYKDNINLNSVMDATISIVTDMCPNWKFSRFARTYNAIVFSSDL